MYILAYSITSVIIITFIIGLFNYKKYKQTPLKYFIYLLGYGVATEILGLFFYDLFGFPNRIIYNIFGLLEFLFYFWLFSKYFKLKKNKRISKLFSGLTFLFFMINAFFIQDIFKNSQSYLYLFGGILLIVVIILFFIEILNSDAILKIKHLPIFWVAVGVFLFQLGFIPVFIAHNYINYAQGLTYGYILLLLNFITGSCFSLGFIWSKKNIDY